MNSSTRRLLFSTLGIVVSLVVGFLVYQNWKVGRQTKRLVKARLERVKPLMVKLEAGDSLNPDDVLPFADSLGSREMTYELLKEHGKLAVFPERLMTIVSSAEANLATWLEFPTELGAIPDELEHVQRVAIPMEDQVVYYEVFRFRMNAPHEMSQAGWMLGVVGPYHENSLPYDFPRATFSRLSEASTTSPEAEARWVHENISFKQ